MKSYEVDKIPLNKTSGIPMKHKRFIEIDLLRGLAIIGMIVFHFFFLLDFLDIKSYSMFTGGWHVLARFVQFTFLGLVGLNLAISHKRSYIKHLRRGLEILGFGLLITMVTVILYPDLYVKFGILHLIGLGIILLSPLAGKPIKSFVVASLILLISQYLRTLTTNSVILFAIGIQHSNINSLDYFPLCPWLAVIAFGITIGHIIYHNSQRRFRIQIPENNILIQKLSFLGRHALAIYLIHIPALFLLIKLVYRS